jgi:hypothetical protein
MASVTQRLAQRKTKRAALNAQMHNQRTPSSRGLTRFMKQVVSNMVVPNKVEPGLLGKLMSFDRYDTGMPLCL